MFCAKCGNELTAGSAFCPTCGNPVGGNGASASTGQNTHSGGKKAPSTSEKNYYEILEITRDASSQEIEAAIKKQRTVWSNRVARGGSMGEHARLLVETIGEAEKTLLDPVKRKAYDDSLTDVIDYQAVIPVGEKNWLEVVYSYYDQHDWEMAAQAVERATSQQPDNPESWFLAANVYLQINDFDRANRAAQQLLLVDPDNPMAYNIRGDVYLMHKDNAAKAIEMYEKAKTKADDPATIKVSDESIVWAKSCVLRARADKVVEGVVNDPVYNQAVMTKLQNCLNQLNELQREGVGYFNSISEPSSWLNSLKADFNTDFEEVKKIVQDDINEGNEKVKTPLYRYGLIWTVVCILLAVFELFVMGRYGAGALAGLFGVLLAGIPGYIMMAVGKKPRYKLSR